MCQCLTNPTKWRVHPAKTQISLGIHPVWSKSSLCAQWVAKDTSFPHADSKDSDQTGHPLFSEKLRIYISYNFSAYPLSSLIFHKKNSNVVCCCFDRLSAFCYKTPHFFRIFSLSYYVVCKTIRTQPSTWLRNWRTDTQKLIVNFLLVRFLSIQR